MTKKDPAEVEITFQTFFENLFLSHWLLIFEHILIFGRRKSDHLKVNYKGLGDPYLGKNPHHCLHIHICISVKLRKRTDRNLRITRLSEQVDSAAMTEFQDWLEIEGGVEGYEIKDTLREVARLIKIYFQFFCNLEQFYRPAFSDF